MAAKIEVALANDKLTISKSQKARGDALIWKDKIQQWSFFVLDTLAEIVGEKSAIVHVFSPDGDFDFPKISAKITPAKKGKDSATYSSASSPSWSKSDIFELVAQMEFALGQMWFEIVAKIDEKKIDPVAFFESANKVINKGEVDGKFQCVGNVQDGAALVWANPDWNEAEKVLPRLEKICSGHGFKAV